MAEYAVINDAGTYDVVRFAIGKSGALYVIVPNLDEIATEPGKHLAYCVVGSPKMRAGSYTSLDPDRILPSGKRLLILT